MPDPVIVDIVGKGRRVRTVPVPGWARAVVDRWAAAAGLRTGLVCRRFRKGGWLVYGTTNEGRTEAMGMSADAIADVVSTYAKQLGWDLSPHDLRRTFAKLARSGQAPLVLAAPKEAISRERPISSDSEGVAAELTQTRPRAAMAGPGGACGDRRDGVRRSMDQKTGIRN